MTAARDDQLRPSAAWEQVMDLAHAHRFEGDGALQQDLYDTLLAYAGAERDAVIAALVAEYAAVLQGRGPWAEQGPEVGHPGAHALRCAVAVVPLLRVAERLGVTDLRARAAAVVARGEGHDDGARTDREHADARAALPARANRMPSS